MAIETGSGGVFAAVIGAMLAAVTGGGAGVAWGRSVERRLGNQQARLDAEAKAREDMKKDLDHEERDRKECDAAIRHDLDRTETRILKALEDSDTRRTSAMKVVFDKLDLVSARLERMASGFSEMRGEMNAHAKSAREDKG